MHYHLMNVHATERAFNINSNSSSPCEGKNVILIVKIFQERGHPSPWATSRVTNYDILKTNCVFPKYTDIAFPTNLVSCLKKKFVTEMTLIYIDISLSFQFQGFKATLSCVYIILYLSETDRFRSFTLKL